MVRSGGRQAQADERVLEQMRQVGAPQEVIDRISAQNELTSFELHADNQRPLALFMSLMTQWVTAGGMNGRLMGLNYASIEAALRLQQVPRKTWPALFSDLQVMEYAALAVLSNQEEN